MFIVDSHCHLDALDYENLHTDIADVVDKAKQRDVKHLLAVGVTLKRFEQAYAQLALFKEVSSLVVFILWIWRKNLLIISVY